MDKFTQNLSAAADKITKGATSAATTITKGATSTATTITKGATSTATTITKGATSTATMVTKGATSGVSKVTKGAISTSAAVAKVARSSISGKSGGDKVSPEEQATKDEHNVLQGLMEKRVTASVEDLDYHRKNNFMVVQTDYIIHVKVTDASDDGKTEFEFTISKTFKAFRELVHLLVKDAEKVISNVDPADLPKKVTQLATYCDASNRLLESQSTEYLGKVNYTHVQKLAKQRSQIINDFLEETMKHFPDGAAVEEYPFARMVAVQIEDFFLSDHCEAAEEGTEEAVDVIGTLTNTPLKKNYLAHSTKNRKSKAARATEEKKLDDDSSELHVDEVPEPRKSPRSSSKSSGGPAVAMLAFLDEKPHVAVGGFAVAMQVLRLLGLPAMTVGLDSMFLLGFACFCFGLGVHRAVAPPTPTPKGRPPMALTEANLMRRQSMANLTASQVAMEIEFESPMKKFPEGAKLGSVMNAWSDPPSTNFMVRGAKYLKDKKKVKSEPYLFPTRGVDIFLTDQCPENVGRITSLMNDELRSLPTFIINFRLPWGVLLYYFEIPERFVPYIKCRYGDGSETKADMEAKMKEMSNSDRCCARFLLGDDEHKNQTLKIFPNVVEGPWVVKASVGGKPAIIGKALPVTWVYAPEGTGIDGKKQALYLEADLDIVSSAAARGVLSVVRSYTQQLTIDLGFGIQGNSEDELPEQMLTGTRMHGIDPMNCPPLPPMKDTVFAGDILDDDTDESSH